jgi:hypothetical protein
MPEELVLVSPPVEVSGRNFYPVVRVSRVIHPAGGLLSVIPTAILIEEEESWFFVALEDDGDIRDTFHLIIKNED